MACLTYQAQPICRISCQSRLCCIYTTVGTSSTIISLLLIMASLRVLAVVSLVLAITQVISASYCSGGSPSVYYDGYGGDGYGYGYDGYLGKGGYPGYGLVEGCCPGKVIEKKFITQKAVNVPYAFSIPTSSRKCFSKTDVERQVIPTNTISQNCLDTLTTIKVPTTNIETYQQPLCKKTCTTSEYVIQIPIVETTCTRSPLCKKTVRSNNNLLTTTTAKTSCLKNVCTSEKVTSIPIQQTVCQDYQGAITKVGSKTVLKPEIGKTCVQLPPYKCLKPASPADILPYSDVYPGSYYPGSPILPPPSALLPPPGGLPLGALLPPPADVSYLPGVSYDSYPLSGYYGPSYPPSGYYGPSYPLPSPVPTTCGCY